MRLIILTLLTLLVLVLPSQANAQGLYGCEWDSVGGICRGFVDCEDGFTHNPSNTQTCNTFGTPDACTQRNFICLSEDEPEPGESGGACRSAEPRCNPGFACLSSGLCAPIAGQTGGNTTPANTAEEVQCENRPGTVNTAIGCIPLDDITGMATFFLRWALGIAGGVALLMIGFAGYRIATSQGDPKRLQGGQELLLSAIGGLLMVILSVYLLRFIGVDLLGIF